MHRDGVDHAATLTADTDRLHRSYVEVFDATVSRDDRQEPGIRLSFIDIGAVLSVFFRDPDGLEGEVLVANPAVVPGV